MSIFDIIGPVMVGPSSSHTAGAVRIGYIGGRLLGEPVRQAQIELYGSFLDTGKGHGTQKGLVAGLLGMQPDDEQIVNSFDLAAEAGIDVAFGEARLEDAMPNTARLKLKSVSGNRLEIIASSTGGGKVIISSIDGLSTGFTGEYPTLIVQNMDQPGHVAEVASALGGQGINIAAMRLYRVYPGGKAVMVIECDQQIPSESLRLLNDKEGVLKVTYLDQGI